MALLQHNQSCLVIRKRLQFPNSLRRKILGHRRGSLQKHSAIRECLLLSLGVAWRASYCCLNLITKIDLYKISLYLLLDIVYMIINFSGIYLNFSIFISKNTQFLREESNISEWDWWSFIAVMWQLWHSDPDSLLFFPDSCDVIFSFS